METWIERHDVYRGKLVTLSTGHVALDDGTTAWREIVHHPGGVAVVPVLPDGVLLVRQFRIAIGREILELPAGLLEQGETAEEGARRELEEEVGVVAGQLKPVASCFVSPGFTDERLEIFLAFDLTFTATRYDPDERIEIVRMPLSDVRARLKARGFEDAKTVIGLRELLAALEERA